MGVIDDGGFTRGWTQGRHRRDAIKKKQQQRMGVKDMQTQILVVVGGVDSAQAF